MPVENPCDNLRSWLQEQKLSALKKNSNRAEKGKNWGVFDFCNQFLQNDEQLKQATLDLCQRLWRKNVVYAEIRFCPELHTEKGLDADQALQSVIAGMNQTTSTYYLFNLSNNYVELQFLVLHSCRIIPYFFKNYYTCMME